MTTNTADISSRHADSDERIESGTIYSWYVVSILVLMMVFSYLDRQIIVLLIDPIRHDLAITDVQISLLTGFAFALLFAVFGIPLGWAADRYNRRWIIIICVLFWGLATVACGLARSFGQLFLGRVAVGVGEAALLPASFSILSDIFSPRRLTLAIAILSIGSPIGMGVSYIISGLISSLVSHGEFFALPLIGEVRGWQVAFILAGLPAPLLALLMLTVREPKRMGSINELPEHSSPDTAAKFHEFLKSHWQFFSCYIVGFALFGMSVYAIFTWAPIYLTRNFNWSAAQVGSIFGAIVAVSITLSLVGGGILVERLYNRGVKDAHIRTYAISALICIPLAIGSVASHNAWIFLAGMFLIQLIMNSYGPSGFTAMQLVAPNEFRARMSALLMLASTIGGVGFGPLFVASITQYVFKDDKMVGWSLAITLAIVYPIGAFLFWKAARYMRQMRQPHSVHPTPVH